LKSADYTKETDRQTDRQIFIVMDELP